MTSMAKRRRFLLAPLALVAAIVVLLASSACKGGDGANGGDETPGGGPVAITLWHSMGAPLSTGLERIIQEFNASQRQYRVEAIYQGSYTDSLNKLISSIGSGNIPTLIQLDDVSTQIMIDSQEIKPIQDFIDDEDYDLSDFDPKVLSYYQIDGTLYSMPFNLAGPILYYDKQLFQEAGLDPDQPPRTLEEVRQYAEQLVERDAQGNTTRYGIALHISPWIFEQMLAKQGALYVNNGNGREGRATEAMFASEEGMKVLRWYDEMIEDGLALNSGRDSTNAMLSIATGQSAMAMESTAALSAAVALIAVSGEDPKRLGTGPLPAPASDAEGGIVLGGASFWVLAEQTDEQQRGAWEFIKFAASPQQQAQWHADTGYFPSRLSAYELPAAVKRRQDFPQFETAVTQLRASPDTPATNGALLGAFRSLRDRVTQAFEEVLSAGADPDARLSAAEQQATGDIEQYNRTAP